MALPRTTSQAAIAKTHALIMSAGIQQQNSVKISLHDTLIKTVKQETDKKPVLNQMRK